jgi:thiamine phosphate synthase YjbQ (UPF0047 family)
MAVTSPLAPAPYCLVEVQTMTDDQVKTSVLSMAEMMRDVTKEMTILMNRVAPERAERIHALEEKARAHWAVISVLLPENQDRPWHKG